MVTRAHWFLPGLLFLLLGAASPPEPSTLSMSGLGPIRIGMTRAQVEALGGAVTPDDVVYDPEHPEQCWEGGIAGVDHVIAMFEGGKLVRLTVTSADIPIEGGAHVGMTEAEAQAAYGGRLLVQPHLHDRDGHYLLVFSDDRARALVLVSDGTRVALAHAGEARAAQYAEGCP